MPTPDLIRLLTSVKAMLGACMPLAYSRKLEGSPAVVLVDAAETSVSLALSLLNETDSSASPARRPAFHRCSATAAGTGEAGDPCDRPMYHEGPHSWDLTSMTAPATFAIPGAPPVDRDVTDGLSVWRRMPTGRYVALDADGQPVPAAYGMDWVTLLQGADKPLRLVPLTPEQESDATLYGPPGARWGQIGDPCPRFECNLWRGHIGAHQDSTGKAIAAAVLAEDDIPPGPGGGLAAITPQESAETPCTCGDPAAHRPGCARYDRDAAGIRRFALTNSHGHVILFAAVAGPDGDAVVRTDRYGQMAGPVAIIHRWLLECLGYHPALTSSTTFGQYHDHPPTDAEPVGYVLQLDDAHELDWSAAANGSGQYAITAPALAPFLVFELFTAVDTMAAAYGTEVTA